MPRKPTGRPPGRPRKKNYPAAKSKQTWQELLLQFLATCPHLVWAAGEAKVSVTTVRNYIASDPVFADKVKEAIKLSIGRIEAKGFEMARNGSVPMITKILEAYHPKWKRQVKDPALPRQDAKINIFMPGNGRDGPRIVEAADTPAALPPPAASDSTPSTPNTEPDSPPGQ